jgi:hypothetical protein
LEQSGRRLPDIHADLHQLDLHRWVDGHRRIRLPLIAGRDWALRDRERRADGTRRLGLREVVRVMHAISRAEVVLKSVAQQIKQAALGATNRFKSLPN